MNLNTEQPILVHKGRCHFSIPKGAKMTLALNEPKWVALYSNSNTISKHAAQVERNYSYCM